MAAKIEINANTGKKANGLERASSRDASLSYGDNRYLLLQYSGKGQTEKTGDQNSPVSGNSSDGRDSSPYQKHSASHNLEQIQQHIKEGYSKLRANGDIYPSANSTFKRVPHPEASMETTLGWIDSAYKCYIQRSQKGFEHAPMSGYSPAKRDSADSTFKSVKEPANQSTAYSEASMQRTSTTFEEINSPYLDQIKSAYECYIQEHQTGVEHAPKAEYSPAERDQAGHTPDTSQEFRTLERENVVPPIELSSSGHEQGKVEQNKPIARFLKSELYPALWFNAIAGTLLTPRPVQLTVHPDLSQAPTANLEFLRRASALAAVGAGAFGVPYHVQQIRESGPNDKNLAGLVGQTLYFGEGIYDLCSFGKSTPDALRHARKRVAWMGAAADGLKAYNAGRGGNYDDVLTYGLMSYGNLRSSLDNKDVTRFYRNTLKQMAPRQADRANMRSTIGITRFLYKVLGVNHRVFLGAGAAFGMFSKFWQRNDAGQRSETSHH